MMLSRLVRDNATSTRYALKRIIRTDGTSTYVPVAGRVAYRADATSRAWLDQGEAEQLRCLLAAYHQVQSTMPPRVETALRFVEDAAYEPFMEDVLAMTVRILEGLTATSREAVTRRFAHRVPQLAAAVGVVVSRTACKRAYSDRSLTYHGVDITHADDESEDRFRARTAQMQAVSRAVVRHAIEDEAFREIFRDNAAIDATWPIEDVVSRLGWRRRTAGGLRTMDYMRDLNERRRVEADFSTNSGSDFRYDRLRAGMTVRDVARAARCSILAVELLERRDRLDATVEQRILDVVQCDSADPDGGAAT